MMPGFISDLIDIDVDISANLYLICAMFSGESIRNDVDDWCGLTLNP
jgi:hypothetical protein